MTGDSGQLGEVISRLCATIERRSRTGDDRSYTAALVGAGTARCARKFGEEAVELVIALMSGNREDIAAEAGDVVYHFLVALRAAGVDPGQVAAVLESRRGGGVADAGGVAGVEKVDRPS